MKDLDYRVDVLWFGANPPDHYDDAFDVVASTHLILDQKATTLALCFDNLVIPWDAILLKKHSGDFSRFLGAQYGYVYQRRLIHGPWASPYGTIAHGGSDKERISDEERERVGK